ncbi:D-galactarate dehydratase [Tropicimonas marinistellae]|uniref:D-galactarate dehydratase n=1 Tax=Tropicimonas marinistellae TaxID=1739787 RepID=UPI000A428F56|nr:D-galactarate dehydratase [Tropicimonas marinistellae]
MRRHGLILATMLVVAGCGQLKMPFRPDAAAPSPAVGVATTGPGTQAAAPPPTAVTVEQFDTTTNAERAAAASVTAAPADRRLGRTIASLGDPADPGFWAETGLVETTTEGRLEYPATGKSVKVELRPSGAAPGAGTRVSLPAMRVLEAPLTELPELVVFAVGAET